MEWNAVHGQKHAPRNRKLRDISHWKCACNYTICILIGDKRLHRMTKCISRGNGERESEEERKKKVITCFCVSISIDIYRKSVGGAINGIPYTATHFVSVRESLIFSFAASAFEYCHRFFPFKTDEKCVAHVNTCPNWVLVYKFSTKGPFLSTVLF